MRIRASSALSVAALSVLTGCANWTEPIFGAFEPKPPAASAYFDFSWELSGDRQAAPLQVFDDGKRMWLQFSASQGEPGLWRPAAEGGMKSVAYKREGPYVVVQDVWPQLHVHAQGGQAVIRRLAPGADSASAEAAPAQAVAADAPSQAVAAVAPSPVAAFAPTPSAASAAAAKPAAPAPQSAAAVPVALSPSAAAIKPGAVSFSVGRADGHMRRALTRWAAQAGWTFQGEHWSADIDIPIAGDAVFDMPFEQAVQALLGATELSDRPLQPCFYSNKVLRVVPFAQACDRTAAPGERT